MIETKKVSINRPYSRARGADGGGCLIFFGVFVAGAATLMVLAVTGVIPSDSMDKDAPPAVLYSVAGLFIGVGLLMIGSGIRGMFRRRRHFELVRLHPDEPWMVDGPWDPRRASDDGGRRARYALFGAAFLVLFLVPFNAVVFFVEDAPIFAKVIIGFFDLLGMWVVGYAIHQLMQRLKYGESHVRYSTFPIHLGDKVTLYFSNARGIGSFEKFAATIRCIQERVVVTGSGKNRSRKTVYDQIYAEAIEINDPGQHRGGSRELEFTYELPAGEYTTLLATQEPRYWEFELTAETPGVDYCARFLLPVYARPDHDQSSDSLAAHP